jgi:lipopolysaccharide/colanic/teichoic acid biosynthesis glycosyltransferase
MESVWKNDPDFISLATDSRSGYYAAKRILDILGTLLVLVLVSPLMLIIAIAIVIYSPGPIFFAQERIGARRQYKNGHSYWKKINFKCYKFRTMKVNADPSIHMAYVKALIENDQKQMAAIQGEATETRKLIHDSRITRPGVFLRKSSLDELPQLWNVLRGDMSLVGPRPPIPYEVKMYKPWHCRRLEAQPGITGLQQVMARCTADFDQEVQFDIEYIEKQSLWFDLKIILKTPMVVISAKGAH